MKKLIEEDLWRGIQRLAFGKVAEQTENLDAENMDTIYDEQKTTQRDFVERNITKIIIAGNTTMFHLLMGYSCEKLGKYPFESKHLGEVHCVLRDIIGEDCCSENAQIPVVLLPGISVFVGADIVSGMLACRGFESSKLSLLIDLGTNGEMVVGNKEKIVVTSVAAGPAFEGGNIFCGCAGIPGAISQVRIQNRRAVVKTIKNVMPPVGICGSGVISVIAQIKKNKLMDKEGKMSFPYDEQGYLLWADGKGKKIILLQKDIREFQLAKAAVRAGIELLLKEYCCRAADVETIYLAGGFGMGISEEDAIETGILPKEFHGKIQIVGNASLKGCIEYEMQQKNMAEDLEKRMVKTISLAQTDAFEEIYLKYLDF